MVTTDSILDSVNCTLLGFPASECDVFGRLGREVRLRRRSLLTRWGMGTGISRRDIVNNSPGPDLPAMFSRYKARVEQELSLAVPSPQDAHLYTLLRYHLGWASRNGEPTDVPISQGKAMRPTLCLFACEALEGDLSQAVPVAAALELIHNFSLIHDDIQDGDLERRHRPTVWHLWGVPRALVAGNAMQSPGGPGPPPHLPTGCLSGDHVKDLPTTDWKLSGNDPGAVLGPGI